MMSSSNGTARMIREGAREADRLCRHFGCLAARLQRRGDGLQIAAAGLPLAALAALASQLPEWVPAACLGLTVAVGLAAAAGRYPHKAAISLAAYQEFGRLATEWNALAGSAPGRDEADLHIERHRLALRQGEALAVLPVELSMAAVRKPSSTAPFPPVGDPQPENRPSDGQ